jgi:glycosyltransferase involved in cell wall biosynthesis
MRILQVNTYPTVLPRHGGQRRAHQIGRLLERAGHQVHRVAAYTFSGYGNPPSERAINLDHFPRPRSPTTWLYDGVRALESDAAALATFSSLCQEADPELILVEEIWLWPAIRQLGLIQSSKLPIIYSSYNIEAPQFHRLLLQMGHKGARRLADDVSALESDIARAAWACVAVTEHDATVLRTLGARRVVVAPNGVEHRNRAHLIGAIPEALRPDLRYLLYVASNHQPNASGIPDFFTAIMRTLRPLERLVVAGGVCHRLAEWLQNGGPSHLARERMILIGDVTDFCLDGLIANASGIVLPLRDGGGSNLKTAEALYSGLPLVATTVAMRGYEHFISADGQIVADDPREFAAGARRVLDGRLTRRQGGPALDLLLWENTLLPIATLIDDMLLERSHRGQPDSPVQLDRARMFTDVAASPPS